LDFKQAGENRLSLAALRLLYQNGFTGSQIGGGRLSSDELRRLIGDWTGSGGPDSDTPAANPVLSKAQVTANRYDSSAASAAVTKSTFVEQIESFALGFNPAAEDIHCSTLDDCMAVCN
jgi:hypothetical protein